MPNNPNLINEEHLPGNWAPADTEVIEPGKAPVGAPAPVPHDIPAYFSGSLAPQLQLDANFAKATIGTPRIPSVALMPFGIQSSAFTNSASQSTAQKTIIIPPTGALTVEAPATLFTLPLQIINLPGTVQLILNAQTKNTFFSGPITGVSVAPTWRTVDSQDLGNTPGAHLVLHGTSGLPTWSAVDLTADVTGVLPVANGGTGDNTLAAHGVLVGNGTSPVSVTTPGTAGQVLTSNGPSADPTFQAITPALAASVEVNGVGISVDKQVYIDAVLDGSTKAWVIQVNGAAA